MPRMDAQATEVRQLIRRAFGRTRTAAQDDVFVVTHEHRSELVYDLMGFEEDGVSDFLPAILEDFIVQHGRVVTEQERHREFDDLRVLIDLLNVEYTDVCTLPPSAKGCDSPGEYVEFVRKHYSPEAIAEEQRDAAMLHQARTETFSRIGQDQARAISAWLQLVHSWQVLLPGDMDSARRYWKQRSVEDSGGIRVR